MRRLTTLNTIAAENAVAYVPVRSNRSPASHPPNAIPSIVNSMIQPSRQPASPARK